MEKKKTILSKEGMCGKRPQVTPDLTSNSPFDLQTYTSKIGRRI